MVVAVAVTDDPLFPLSGFSLLLSVFFFFFFFLFFFFFSLPPRYLRVGLSIPTLTGGRGGGGRETNYGLRVEVI